MLISQTQPAESATETSRGRAEHARIALIAGSAALFGSRRVPSEEVDKAFGMPVGKLRERAGIESLAYAADGETELTLAARVTQQALSSAAQSVDDLDWIIATSETHQTYPS